MQKLLILGAGGHGKVVADIAASTHQWSEIAFLDDRYQEIKQVISWKVLGSYAQAKELSKYFSHAIVAIGDNQTRLNLSKELEQLGFSLPIIVHPSAFVSTHATVGAGSVVFPQAAINIGAVIAMAAIINTGAIIEHDCSLDAGVHVSPNAALAGGVIVGKASWLGLGACVIQKITIGANVIVGAGAVVTQNIPDNVTAVGVPAKVIKNANANARK